MKKILLLLFLFPQPSLNYAQWYQQYSESAGYFLDIDFTSVNNGWVVGLWKMMRTTDGGNNWITLIDRPQSNTMIQAISFVNDTTGWYVEQNGDESHCTVYKTINGGTDWTQQYISPQLTLIWDLQFINQNIGFAIGSDPTFPILFKTTDGGNSWNIFSIDNIHAHNLFTIFFLDPLHGWAGGVWLYKTTDGGVSWNMLPGPFFDEFDDIQFTTSDIGWYSGHFGINKTTDGGSSWIQQATGGDGWYPSSLYFLDSDTGYFCPFNAVLKTTTSGFSWDIQLQDNSLNLSDVCFVNPNDGWISEYTPGRIFHTSNGGTPVELISLTGTVIDGNVHLNWVTATEINNQGFEVLRSNQYANDWLTISFIPGNGTTTEQQYYSFIDEVLSPGRYGYKLKQIDYDGTFEFSDEIEVEVIAPLQFRLEQNYPNPFNPNTTISFQIHEASTVTLKVYDALGTEIETIAEGNFKAGIYKIVFNASELSSGIYFYQLISGIFKETKKMIVMK